MKEIYLIDGSCLIYRSFYALPKLKTSTGITTNAIYGFTTTLIKILKEKKPEYMAIFFDLHVPTFRHITFEKYKEKRKPMPDELSGQITKIKEITTCFGIKYFEKEGYEADDLIASAIKKLRRDDLIFFIISSDKDILQLVNKNVFIINPVNYSLIDEKSILQKYGFKPEKIIDFIGLAGDASDNIPGIQGIGEKTATFLLSRFNSIEEIYENIEKIESKSLKTKLEQNKDIAFLSKKLSILDKDALNEIDLEDIKISRPNISKLLEIFDSFEFKKLKEVIKKIYPELENIKEIEDYIGFSIGKFIRYTEILKNPEKYKEIIEDKNIKKIGFDLKSKIVELKTRGIEFENIDFDFSIAKHLTGKIIYDRDIFKLKNKYENILTELNMYELFTNVEMPLIEVIAWLETNGIKVDIEYLKQLDEKFNIEIEEIVNKIYSLTGEVFNLNSPSQVGEILFEKLKLPVIKKTKTTYATDTHVLKELSSFHPLPKYILDYREIHKIKSTYIEGLLGFVNEKTGRIHPNYSQISTSTGRLTCSNPNLQNLPVKTQKGGLVRKAFCAEKDNLLISFDYSQIELRVLAHFSEDPVLINAFEKDKDIHSETAELILASNSLFTPLNFSELTKEEKRRIAKTINFGIIYGISPYGLSQELGISVEESSNFIEKYFEKFKKVKLYIENITKKAEENGYVETLLKRRRYIPELKSPNKNEREFGKRVAINMPIQGTASEIIKVAMNRIYQKFKHENLKSKLVLQIHDELLFEVLPDEENKVIEIVKEIMKNAIILKVPIKVDIKKGRNFLEMEDIND
ncbi:MAG: DNA polymerase I [Candidatus Omnitrophica bacterium]|nr:DNA polymerase I [Candidatus Omnitrophota bacterium]MCM8801873.1 DNA polymerase I [Candidatus Omnitrophota bacterium]